MSREEEAAIMFYVNKTELPRIDALVKKTETGSRSGLMRAIYHTFVEQLERSDLKVERRLLNRQGSVPGMAGKKKMKDT